MVNQEIIQLSTKFDQLATQFGQLNSRFDELVSFLVDQFGKVATKDDLAELRSEMNQGFAEVRSGMVTKGELASLRTELMSEIGEVREIVTRIDRRSDEDIRAVMKDVEKIKTYLVKRGHHI